MLLSLLAAAIDESAVPVSPTAIPAPAGPIHNYLKPPPVTCDRSNLDEVVVCAGQEDRYRLRPVDGDEYSDPPIRAERNFAGGVLGIGGDQANVGGFPSNRMMLSFKIKF
jgi:hypothetical protein